VLDRMAARDGRSGRRLRGDWRGIGVGFRSHGPLT
jgi:hypothetical protein